MLNLLRKHDDLKIAIPAVALYPVDSHLRYLFVALAVGVPLDARGLRGDFLIAGVIALAPAAGGYLLVRKTGSVLDAWRVRAATTSIRKGITKMTAASFT